MAYWTDIFTLETWAQAEARGFTVSGFPPPTASKGGYSIGMFERVEAGDMFLCYCKNWAEFRVDFADEYLGELAGQ